MGVVDEGTFMLAECFNPRAQYGQVVSLTQALRRRRELGQEQLIIVG
jgi:hypothetical protein